MKNIYDILTEYGLTVPEDKKTEFDKAVAENYKTAVDYGKQAEKLKLAEDKVTTTESALKKFDGVDVDKLQGEINTLKTDLGNKDTEYQQKIADMEFSNLLDGAISTAKGKNSKAVMALLDMDALKISKNQSEDIKTALEAVKKDNGYLFEGAQQEQTTGDSTGGAHGDASAGDIDKFAAAAMTAAGLNTETK